MLARVAAELVAGTTTHADARRRSSAAVAGEVRKLIGGAARVMPSTAAVTQELQEITQLVRAAPPDEAVKWAATLVLVYAQHALGLIGELRNTVASVVQVSRCKCPAGASGMAVAMIDVALEETTGMPPPQIAQLNAARLTFMAI